jgi:TonB-dependent starch-binding outer membrane protein SusC
MKRKINFLMALLLFGVCFVSAQQNLSVSGVVSDASDGSPMIGVSVFVKGTTSATITDVNGKYVINASQGSKLIFTYIGMKRQEISVKGNVINTSLESDSQLLNEVVAIGYGTMKKKLITGSTVQVSGDQLQKRSTTNALSAMQSQTSGVNITQSSGQPGENFKVNIRGVGTIANSDPLYVIDGVAGGDINSLNPSDIESVDVLKDGASSAIYGARAANGVVLIATKQGKAGKLMVSYDGYYGVQNIYKMPSLLNAKQYMQVEDQMDANQGITPNNWKTLLGTTYNAVMAGQTTNWIDVMRYKNAPTQNHAINITGGNEISKFSMGVSNTSQDGIFGKQANSSYKRTTARLNSDHIILKNKSFNIIKIGETLNFNHSVKHGIGIGTQYVNDISNALIGCPLIPVYGANGNYFDHSDQVTTGFNVGNIGGATNPVGEMVARRGNNETSNYNLNMSANLQLQPIKDLIFKSQFGYKMSANTFRNFQPTYNFSANISNTDMTVQQTAGAGYNYSLENTLNYKFNFNVNHFDALIGQSIEKTGLGSYLSATNDGYLFNDYAHAFLSNTSGTTGATAIIGGPGASGTSIESKLSSFFGRVSYDYNETYMATVVMRADGSSNFGSGHRWGYFPSVAAGWVISNESFMESAKNWLDFLKIRGSWGENGNCNIAPFQYIASVALDGYSKYSFGNNPTVQSPGGYPNILSNPDVKWETSVQSDFGFDARFLNSRLNVTFDYYNKATNDWLVIAPQLASFGTGAPYINGGDIVNKGYEIALGWNDHIGKDLTYGASVNASFNHNEVTRIANTEGIIHGALNVLSQSTSEMYRAQVGYPIGYFYGFKTSGVFQNTADITSWKAAGNGILQGATVQPGDLKFTDINHDGVIDEKDKTMIGDPNPNMTLGINFNLGYKGFDLGISAHGAFGQQIAKSYRSFADSRYDNFTTDVLSYWHGEGTSNKYPRLTQGSNANFSNISDIYIENGDYLRISNITIGYDFKKLFPKMPLTQARLYFTAQNLFTITKYSGMDPEIGSNAGTADSWASGIDIGMYPSPRTYLVGINLKF